MGKDKPVHHHGGSYTSYYVITTTHNRYYTSSVGGSKPKLFSSEKSWGLVNSRLNSLKSQCMSPNFASLTSNDTHCRGQENTEKWPHNRIKV